jgi:proteasome lid subunit RPN8/RPN11
MRPGLIVPADIREAILNHTANCYPQECCGLIAIDAEGRIRFAYPLTNTDGSATSFTIDAEESFHTFLHAERMGWDISGVFHSHPHGPDTLSERDLAEAPVGWIHLLATSTDLKAFRITDARPVEMVIA